MRAFCIISFPESSSRNREYRDCVCLWDPLPQHRQCHPTELHQVCTFLNSLRRVLNPGWCPFSWTGMWSMTPWSGNTSTLPSIWCGFILILKYFETIVSPQHLIHLDGFNVLTKFTQSHPRPLTWRRSSKGSIKGTHTSKFILYKDAFLFDLYIKLTLLFRFYRLSDRLILNNALDTEMGSSDIDSAMRCFPTVSENFCLLFLFPGISERSLNTCSSFAIPWESCVMTLSMTFQKENLSSKHAISIRISTSVLMQQKMSIQA